MASLLLGSLPMASHSFTQTHALSFSRSQTLVGVPLSISSLSLSSSSSPNSHNLIYCGRGDKKTERGKRFNHSFGNARPRNKKKGRGPPRVPIPAGPPKKDRFNDELPDIEIDESLE